VPLFYFGCHFFSPSSRIVDLLTPPLFFFRYIYENPYNRSSSFCRTPKVHRCPDMPCTYSDVSITLMFPLLSLPHISSFWSLPFRPPPTSLDLNFFFLSAPFSSSHVAQPILYRKAGISRRILTLPPSFSPLSSPIFFLQVITPCPSL